MPHKPDHYHQTNPPCELKSVVLGRQNSKKSQKQSDSEAGEGSDASTCSVVLDHDELAFVIESIENRREKPEGNCPMTDAWLDGVNEEAEKLLKIFTGCAKVEITQPPHPLPNS